MPRFTKRSVWLAAFCTLGCASEEAVDEDARGGASATTERDDDDPHDARRGWWWGARRPGDAGSDAASSSKRDAGRPARDASTAPSDDAMRDASHPSAPESRDPVPGSADASVGSAPSDSPGSAGGCSAGAFCADFEDQSPGRPLQGAWSVVTPRCTGDGKVTVQSEVVHSGRTALRMDAGGGYCNHVFATPKLTPDQLRNGFWTRFYVRFAQPLGDGHTTFLAMHDQVSGQDLRMGGQKSILMWNREQGDATLPVLSPAGTRLSASPAANTWACIEYHFDGDRGTLETFLDGKRLEGLVLDRTPTENVDVHWLEKLPNGAWAARVDDLRFGWESYAGQPMTLWIDDVIVGSTRPGC